MNLEKLRIKNINSFEGEFEIDFEKFKNELFLISGPTGAGKSTIIDAILAALYDKTPRLSASKYLLNEDAKEGIIELCFSVQDDRYRINWSVKRNKKGEIGNVKRVLYKNDELLADKRADILKELLKIIKLDFNEFTKSIVLAQGEFDAFLSAGDSEKAKVLERILNVKEFELISIKVYEKAKSLAEEIALIRRDIENIGEIGDLKDKEKEFKSVQKLAEKLSLELKEIEEKLEKKKKKESLLKENEEVLEKLKKIRTDMENHQKELEDLDFSKKERDFLLQKEKILKDVESLDIAVTLLVELQNKNSLLNSKKAELEILQKELEELEKIEENLKNELEKKEIENNSIEIVDDERLKNFENLQEIYLKLLNLREEYKKKLTLKKKYENEIEEKKELERKIQNEIKDLEEKEAYLKAKILVLEYEEKRRDLKENEPCPLCGSTIHPYVKNPPKISEEIKNEYQKVKMELETKQKELEKVKKEIYLIDDRIKNLGLNEILSEGKRLREEFEKFGIKEEEFDKLKAIKEKNDKNRELKTKLQIEITKLKANLESVVKEKAQKNKKIEDIKKEMQVIQKEMEKIKNDKNFDFSAKEKKEKLKKELSELEREFEKTKEKHNFLSSEIKKLKALKEEYENRIEKNKKEISSIEDVDIDESVKLRKSEELNEINKKIGLLSAEISELERKQAQKEAFEKELKEKSEKYKVIEKLNGAIGSAKGDKFKKIAINFLLESLLSVANMHLERITNGRYLFEKSDDLQKLSLYIVDRFYENKKREVSTLSGGEKFLASLALSFGLSDMVRDKVDIEVMFLDEGFGTLDNESLYRALNILKEASRGKSVGIISHVDSLKEEITKQIKVIKKPNGRSEIVIKA
ncbi:AAA family ATPase [Caminibacter pacificus]